MQRKKRRSLGLKVGSTIISIYLAITILIAFFVHYSNEIQIKETYTSRGQAVAQMISSIIPSESLTQYCKEANRIVLAHDPTINPAAMPESYQKFRRITSEFTEKLQVEHIYIRSFSRNNIVYLFDSDEHNPHFFAETIPYESESHSIDYANDLQQLKTVAQSIDASQNLDLFSILKPIADSDGNLICHIRVDVDLSQARMENRNESIFSAVINVLIAIIFSVLTYRYFYSKMISPIEQLSAAAIQFNTRTDITPLPTENPDSSPDYESVFDKLNITSSDEIGKLYQCLKNMEIDIHKQVNDLLIMNQERESVQEALKIASTIQTSLLPVATKVFPGREEFAIFPFLHTSDMVSGDFYDFYWIDNQHLCITIGDIACIGLPAALLMVRIRTLLRDHSMQNFTPAQILSHVNNQLCEESIQSMFASLWLGILDVQTGDILYANAGHQYPIVNANGDYEYLRKSRNNLVVGVRPDQHYQNHLLHLENNCDLILYSDGVICSTNRRNELFGRNRVLDVLNACRNLTIEQAITTLHQNVLAFGSNSMQYEDIVLIGLRFFGSCSHEEISNEKPL